MEVDLKDGFQDFSQGELNSLIRNVKLLEKSVICIL